MQRLFLLYIVPAFGIAPIIAGIIKYNVLSRPSKLIFFYALAEGAMNCLSTFTSVRGINNLVLMHIYSVCEFLLLSFFFSQILQRPKVRTVIKITAVLFTLICILNSMFFQNIKQFNAYTLSLEALLMIAYSFVYLDQESRVKQAVSWQSNAVNWQVTGILIYFAASLFFFLFLNIMLIKLSITAQLVLWDMHGVFLIVMYALFTVGFLNERRNR